jgi:hypothetical protein
MMRIDYKNYKGLKALACIAASCHRFASVFDRYELLDSIYVRQDGWAFATNAIVMLAMHDHHLQRGNPIEGDYLLKLAPYEVQNRPSIGVHDSQVHIPDKKSWPDIGKLIPGKINKIEPARFVGHGGCWALTMVQRILDPKSTRCGIWAQAPDGKAVWLSEDDAWQDLLLVYQCAGEPSDIYGLGFVNEKIDRVKEG